jgi:archaeal flagellar protein FlaJ
MSYASISYQFFGNLSHSIKPYFIDIRDTLHKGNINYTLEEYLSIALFSVTITFIAETMVLAFIFGLFIEPLIAVMLAVTLSATLSGGLFFFFYSYPGTLVKHRRSQVRKVLPFAVSYMATIASSRISPLLIFKTLSSFKEYGYISKEAELIVKDVEVFGMNVSTAIKKEAKRTPSKEFGELLWGVNGIMTSGGDLADYLHGKSETFMSDYRRRIRKYANDLSLYVEIYLTLIITGAIFFIVLTSVIATISGGAGVIMMQTFIVFLLLPGLSIGFMVLMKSVSPLE